VLVRERRTSLAASSERRSRLRGDSEESARACPPCTRIGGPTWTRWTWTGPANDQRKAKDQAGVRLGCTVLASAPMTNGDRGAQHGGPWSGSSRPMTGESRWMPTRRCRGSGSKTRFRTLKTFTVSEIAPNSRRLPKASQQLGKFAYAAGRTCPAVCKFQETAGGRQLPQRFFHRASQGPRGAYRLEVAGSLGTGHEALSRSPRR
jgi:hypothetical protein